MYITPKTDTDASAHLTHEESAADREISCSEDISSDGVTVEQAFKVLFVDNPPHLQRGYPYDSYYPTPTKDNHLSYLGLSWIGDQGNEAELDFLWNERACDVIASITRFTQDSEGNRVATSDEDFFMLWFEQKMPYWEGIRPANRTADPVRKFQAKAARKIRSLKKIWERRRRRTASRQATSAF